MANQLTKDLEIMFEDYIEGYDAACVISMEAEKSFPDPQSMQRAGDVFYKPMDYMATVTTVLFGRQGTARPRAQEAHGQGCC
jgi:hypothetical protein